MNRAGATFWVGRRLFFSPGAGMSELVQEGMQVGSIYRFGVAQARKTECTGLQRHLVGLWALGPFHSQLEQHLIIIMHVLSSSACGRQIAQV